MTKVAQRWLAWLYITFAFDSIILLSLQIVCSNIIVISFVPFRCFACDDSEKICRFQCLNFSSESLKVQDQTLESCFKVLQRFLKSSLWSFSSQLLQFILRRRKAVYQNSPKHFPFRERKNNGVEKVRWYLHPGRDTFERKVVEMWGAAQNKVSLCRSAVFCGKQERKKLCFSFIILKLQIREIIECEWTGFFLVERTNILISDMFRSTF